MIREKAMLKAIELDIRGFTASSGWATNFCRRNSLKMRRRAGEGGDSNDALAELGMHGITPFSRS